MPDFAGLINLDRSQPIDATVVERMRYQLAGDDGVDRGCDNTDTVALFGSVESAPNKTAPDDNGNEYAALRIAFSGSLTNQVELIAALGLPSSGESDRSATTILRRGYRQWGIEELARRLAGPFAFCIDDPTAGHTYIACDRLGVVPVFYAERHRQLSFATRMRPLIASGLVNPKLNQSALISYLAFGGSIGSDTLLTGAKRLPPGHYVDCALSGVSIMPYAPTVVDVTTIGQTSRAETVESLRSALWDCVRDIAERDESVAVLMDHSAESRAVACMLAKLTAEPVETIHIRYTDQRTSDVDEVPVETAKTGCKDGDCIAIDAEDISLHMDTLAGVLDEPAADPRVAVYSYLAARLKSRFGRLVTTMGLEHFGLMDPSQAEPTGATNSHHPTDVNAQRAWLDISHGLGARLDCEVIPLPRLECTSPVTRRPYTLNVATIWNLLGAARRPSMAGLQSHLIDMETRALGDAQAGKAAPLATRFALEQNLSRGLVGHMAAVRAATELQCHSVLLGDSVFPQLAQVALGDGESARMSLRSALSDFLDSDLAKDYDDASQPPMLNWMRGSLQQFIRQQLLDGNLVKLGEIDRKGLEALFLAQGEVGVDLARPIWSLICLERWYASILDAFPGQDADADGPLIVEGIAPDHYLAANLKEPHDSRQGEIDLVMPVYGGLNYVKDAVRSILRHTDVPFRLIIVDDSECDATYVALEAIADWDERIVLLRNDKNLGFVQTANRGMEAATAEYICLINSDIIVTEGWLSRMLRCAESDARIAAVNPLSNMAVNVSVAMAPGLNLNTMSRRLTQVSRRNYPDITTAVGYCMLIRRKYLSYLGVFDEVFGAGYCEESDFCMRLTEEGLRIVAADDAFVYHKGSGSFGTWIERYNKNRKIFDRRWAFAYQRDYDAFLHRNPLQYVRDALLRNSIASDEWSRPIALAWDRFDRDQLHRRGRSFDNGDVTIAAKTTAGALIRHVGRRPRTELDPCNRKVRFPTRAYIDRLPDIKRMRITFLIADSMPICGGVICITQLAREMLIAGHDVKIVTTAREVDPEKFNLPTQPLVYPEHDELIRLFPPSDIVIATFWTTAFLLMPKLRKHYDFVSSYYVQDYEAYFYPDDDFVQRAQAASTYTLTEYRVVMSQWLKQLIERKHGVVCDKIHMGIDLGVFRPRSDQQSGARGPQIAYNARPDAPRRGFDDAVKAFQRVHAERPDVEFVFFGTEDEGMPSDLPFPIINRGRIYDPNKVAQMLSDAAILLDSSHFQGFGRPGLEAMACGTPPVLTNEGGVNEYATDDENCLMVSPRDHGAMADRMLRLLNDPALSARLRAGGLATAQEYCHMDEARIHLDMYEQWLERKYGLGDHGAVRNAGATA